MIRQADVISPAYAEMQRTLHARPEGFGGKGDKWTGPVLDLAREFRVTSILDYGCGQGRLAAALQAAREPSIRISEYDPGVPGKDALPSFADLVVCTDVLEHVEPERLPAVLEHLQLLARKAVFVVIATRASNKTLPDGRNAHLILEDAAWWQRTVEAAGFAVRPGPKSPEPKPSREWVAVLT